MAIQAIVDPLIAGAADLFGAGAAVAPAAAATEGALAPGQLAAILGASGGFTDTGAFALANAPLMDAAATAAGVSSDLTGAAASAFGPEYFAAGQAAIAEAAAAGLSGATPGLASSAVSPTSTATGAATPSATAPTTGATVGGATAPSSAVAGGPAGGVAGGTAPVSAAAPSIGTGDITTASLPVSGGSTASASTGAANAFSLPGASTGAGGIGSDAVAGGALGAAPTATLNVAAPSGLQAALGSLGSSAGDFASTLGSNFMKSLASPASLLAGGGLAYQLLKGNKKPEGYGALQSEAQNMQAQGNQLSSYLSSGTLPPGIQSGLEQAHRAAEATIRSQYASRGQSGSSAEAQDLANLSQTVVANGAQIATNLLQQGINEQNLASSIYANLMQTNIAQDAALSQSIANFAGALGRAGSPGTFTLTPTQT